MAYKPVLWIEWVLALIFGLNALYHIICYSNATLNLRPIALSPRQKRLLGINEDEPLFNTGRATAKLPEESSPINLSALNLSRRSLGSPGLNESSKSVFEGER